MAFRLNEKKILKPYLRANILKGDDVDSGVPSTYFARPGYVDTNFYFIRPFSVTANPLRSRSPTTIAMELFEQHQGTHILQVSCCSFKGEFFFLKKVFDYVHQVPKSCYRNHFKGSNKQKCILGI